MLSLQGILSVILGLSAVLTATGGGLFIRWLLSDMKPSKNSPPLELLLAGLVFVCVLAIMEGTAVGGFILGMSDMRAGLRNGQRIPLAGTLGVLLNLLVILTPLWFCVLARLIM